MERPKDTEMAVDPHLSQWALRALTRLMAVVSIGLGVTVLIGGEARFMGASFEAARAAPGAPWSWGVAALVAGLTIAAGTITKQPRIVAGGAWLGAFWAILFGWSFLVTFHGNVEVAGTGMWVYLFLACAYGLIGGVHYVMDPIGKLRCKL